MNPYLFTITFLMMMSFLTSSEAIRFAQSSIENTCYQASRNCLAEAEELRELSHLEEFRGDEKDDKVDGATKDLEDPSKISKPRKATIKRIPRLDINTSRPPNNSRLNIFNLIKEPNKNLPKEFSLYEVMARLIRTLYQDESFLKNNPHVEYRILDQLIEKKEEMRHFTTPDELATLFFDDPQVQQVLFQMLKGTKKSPSLLNYITFDTIEGRTQRRKINFLFANPLIVEAIFPEGDVAKKLLAGRARIWAEILDQEAYRLKRLKEQCKGRDEFKKDLLALLEEVLVSDDLNYKKYKEQVFDYGLGKPGFVIFVEDPFGKIVSREKYIPPPKASER